jgi:SAM-dependent methyltransferase
MVKMDITNIQYPAKTFDVILCSHVLEHVIDDKGAIREIFRVLKDNGWAILLVPISSDRTFENPSISSPADRIKIFGQQDHVRRYGPDYVDRLREAGFNVEIFKVNDLVQGGDVEKMGLNSSSGEIFYCTKSV